MSSVAKYAPIKKEYLQELPQSKTNQQLSESQTHATDLDITEPPKKKRKTNERGQNKSRAKRHKMRYDIILCPDIGRGKTCKFGDKCKYSHNVEKYLKCSKPKDIGSRCILFEALGECPHGYFCRFAEHHIHKDNAKLIINKTNINDKHYVITKDLNILHYKSAKFLNKLKPNNLEPFPITKQIIKYYKQFNDLYHPTKRLKIYKTNKENKDKIQINNGDKIENVFKFKNRNENDIKLKKIYKENDGAIPNYYSSLNLIDLEPRTFDIKNKLYLAPLTTVGNLPFRRICIEYGAQVTCSEMVLCTNVLRGNRGECALFRRHETEKMFGIQIAGGFIDSTSKVLEYFHHSKDCMDFKYDFIDLNVGCPLEEINNKRCGAGLMRIPYHLRTILRGMHSVTNSNLSQYSKGAVPITCKMRMGFMHAEPNAKEIVDVLCDDGVSAIGIHGRSRQQRYRRPANWEYIKECAAKSNVPIIGNGDVFNWNEWYEYIENTKCDTLMIGRGALIKPWIFKEIKERKHIDISSSERLDIIRRFVNYGLERWGSDQRGVDNTRRFALEWISFLCRYIPIGILERAININEGVPSSMYYVGRNELETLMSSKNVNDWIKITEMFLGPINDSNFVFIPKHKANAYAQTVIDDQKYVLNDLGELIKINDNTNDIKQHCVLTTTVLGKKRKLNEC